MYFKNGTLISGLCLENATLFVMNIAGIQKCSTLLILNNNQYIHSVSFITLKCIRHLFQNCDHDVPRKKFHFLFFSNKTFNNVIIAKQSDIGTKSDVLFRQDFWLLRVRFRQVIYDHKMLVMFSMCYVV